MFVYIWVYFCTCSFCLCLPFPACYIHCISPAYLLFQIASFVFPSTLDFDMKKNLSIPIYIPILLTFCNKFACAVMLLNISLLYNMFFCD